MKTFKFIIKWLLIIAALFTVTVLPMLLMTDWAKDYHLDGSVRVYECTAGSGTNSLV